MVRRAEDTDSEVCSLRDNINFPRRQHVHVTPYTELTVSLKPQPLQIRQLWKQFFSEIQYKQLDIWCVVCKCNTNCVVGPVERKARYPVGLLY